MNFAEQKDENEQNIALDSYWCSNALTYIGNRELFEPFCPCDRKRKKNVIKRTFGIEMCEHFMWNKIKW